MIAYEDVSIVGPAMKPGALHFDWAEDEWISWDELFRGILKPDHPLKLARMKGYRQTDLISTSHTAVTLVSERVLDVLTVVGATGWATYPVRPLLQGGEVLRGYAGLSVTGHAGPTQRRGMRIRPTVGPFGGDLWEEVGPEFDVTTWDGSDLFSPSNTFYTCVSPKVRDALLAAGLTNLEILPLGDMVVRLHSEPPP